MTNQDILQIALQQSAYDCNCAPEDFLSQQNLVTRSRKHALARKYLPLPFACDMVSYGNNIVAQTSEELPALWRHIFRRDPLSAAWNRHTSTSWTTPWRNSGCKCASWRNIFCQTSTASGAAL